MSDYTPETRHIEAAFVTHTGHHTHPGSRKEQWDRWLAEHDRQVAERAWDEGFDHGFYSGQALRSDADASESTVENPYTKEEQS